MNNWIYGKPDSIITVKPGASQYDGMRIEKGTVCEAIYRKTTNEEYQNNLLIAALPPMMDEQRIEQVFRKEIAEYHSEEMNEPSNIRKSRIHRLRKLRIPLCYDGILAEQIHSAMVNSYSARYPYVDTKGEMEIHLNGEEMIQHVKMLGSSADPTNECFSLTGFTGCGKSTAISQCLSYYPQLIRHNTKYGLFLQIPFVHVSCFPNSNLQQFLYSFFIEVGRIIGTETAFIKKLSKRMTLPEGFEMMQRLVEVYSIGIILIDEIQLMDFASNKANSFEELLSLMNNTKVAIGIIGTEDARAKILQSPRIARRFQHDIRADDYCQDRVYFASVIKDIWHYQWFDHPVPLTNEIIGALCDSTKCVISQLICLLLYMNYDYLCCKKRPMVDDSFVVNVMHRHFSNMEEVLKHIGESTCDEKRGVELAKMYEKFEEITDKANQDKSKKQFEKRNQKQFDDERCLRENVVHSVQKVTMCSANQITEIFNMVYKYTKTQDRNEKHLANTIVKFILDNKLSEKFNIDIKNLVFDE